MAIVSISRIQHRRGLRVDLPDNLNEGEFGWCLDTRELFIGNSNAFTGNSQILTQWSPNDKLIKHVFRGSSLIPARTGANGHDIVRSIGSKLDDWVSVKDYGAVGDGVVDDTDAIQRAIVDIWRRRAGALESEWSSRNVLHFPSGEYRITRTIKLYPYTTLRGEGKLRSIITLASGSTGPVFRTADSNGEISTNIGLNAAVFPVHIRVEYLSLNGSTDTHNDICLFERCNDITVYQTELVGGWQPGDSNVPTNAAIRIASLGTVHQTNTINVEFCTLHSCSQGIYCADPVVAISMIYSAIQTCYRGISFLGQQNGPSMSQVSLSVFDNIEDIGLEVDTYNDSISSLGNRFKNVGEINNVPVVKWYPHTKHASSIGDTFVTQLQHHLRVENGNPGSNVVFNAQGIEIVTNEPTTPTLQLLPNQTDTFTGIRLKMYDTDRVFAGFVDYSLRLDNYYRSGRLQIISDTVTVNISDHSTELNNDQQVVFSAVVSGLYININYTSTGMTPGKLNYITTQWSTEI
jgi:Pectate lyase superfamily protein/Major tropism determinant N-terminal domain